MSSGFVLSTKRKRRNPAGSKEETPRQKSIAVTVTRGDLLLPSQTPPRPPQRRLLPRFPVPNVGFSNHGVNSGFGNEELGDARGGHFRGGRVLGDLPPTVPLGTTPPRGSVSVKANESLGETAGDFWLPARGGKEPGAASPSWSLLRCSRDFCLIHSSSWKLCLRVFWGGFLATISISKLEARRRHPA